MSPAPVRPPGRRRVVLLGATGSIGRQCCDVVARHPDRFELVGVVGGSDAAALAEVARRFGVRASAVVSPRTAVAEGIAVGVDAACAIAAMECDVVCVAIPGAAALAPTLAALDAGNTIATATKEVLVMAGDLVRRRATASGAAIIPVDSEHSALWQCLRGEQPSSVRRLVLTASGGPFRERDPATFAQVTVEEALRHPTWTMGPKVTIDSATMMNKGLEIIEAHYLFDVAYADIGVVIHPSSLVHSFVEFVDGAVVAQLGIPDMRVPIALAIADGERLPDVAPLLDLTTAPALEFFDVDPSRFPAVGLARRAGESGGVAAAVLNAANEVAVAGFLDRRLRYDELVAVVAQTVDDAPTIAQPTLEDVLEADSWARARAAEHLRAVAVGDGVILDVLAVVGAVILVLLTVVLVHEGGHFVVAKLSGVRVDEFSVGFGPRLASRMWGETTYSLRLVPAGGFVRMAGMLGLEGEADAGERNFYRASIPKRLATILAGIAANMVFAGLLFSVIFALPNGSRVQPGTAAAQAGLHDGDVIVRVDGAPIRHDTAADVSTDLHNATARANGRPMTVEYTSSGSGHTVTMVPSLILVNGVAPIVSPSPSGATPAAGRAAITSVSQLPVGEEFVVTAIDGKPVGTGDPAQLLGGATPAEAAVPASSVHLVASASPIVVSGFLINTDGTRGAAYTGLNVDSVGDGGGADGAVQAAWRLGIAPSYDGEPVTQALGDGFGQIPSFITSTYSAIANIVTNPKSGGLNGPQGLSGPVGIVQETVTATHQGGRSLAYWIAFVSMNLGLVNVLPIPFLDGGKAVLIMLEAVRRRRLDPRREAMIYAIGLAIVVVFVVYVTIGDVGRSL